MVWKNVPKSGAATEKKLVTIGLEVQILGPRGVVGNMT